MRAVNIATLKAKLSEYVRAAKGGETIRILDRIAKSPRCQVFQHHGVYVLRRIW